VRTAGSRARTPSRAGASTDAEGRGRPGRDDQRRRRAAHDRRAEEDHVARVRHLPRRDVEIARVLLGRHRLARECRLLDMKVTRVEQAGVGGNPIPGGEPDDVAGDQIAPSNLDPAPITEGARRRRHSVSQSFGDSVGAIGLDEVEHDTQRHHEDDDGGIDPLAEQRGGEARDEKNDDQRIRQKEEDLDEASRPRCPRGLVRADLAEPPARLVGGQASA